MIDTEEFYNCLIKNGMDFFCGVPDSLLKNLCAYITDHTKSEKNIITANEGNAVALAAGYHLSKGKYGVVYMQNSGIGNAVNPLLSLTDEEVYNIPLLMIIGWRGEPGTKDEPQHVKQGKVTLDLLNAMNIKHIILDEDYINQIKECKKYMKETNKPIALIVKKGIFSEYKLTKEKNNFNLTREQSLEIVLNNLSEEDIVVSTTGKTSREIFELREKNNQGHSNDFLTVGSMGHTSSIALGISLGTKKNVYTIDGDGSFLMHMGSFAINAQNAKKNFKYILINNGAHESVGGQPTVAFKIKIDKVLKALGFKKVFTAENENEIKEAIEKMKNTRLCALIIYTKQGSREDLGRPTTSPIENKNAIMEKIKS